MGGGTWARVRRDGGDSSGGAAAGRVPVARRRDGGSSSGSATESDGALEVETRLGFVGRACG